MTREGVANGDTGACGVYTVPVSMSKIPHTRTTSAINSLLSCKILNNSTCLLVHLKHANRLPTVYKSSIVHLQQSHKQVTHPALLDLVFSCKSYMVKKETT